jgi:hypothetical protein
MDAVNVAQIFVGSIHSFLTKIQGSDTKFVAQMQPLGEARIQRPQALNGRRTRLVRIRYGSRNQWREVSTTSQGEVAVRPESIRTAYLMY